MLLGRVVRDAWHQCWRRPLVVVVGGMTIGMTPGFPPHMIRGSQDLHGWANLLWVLLPAVIVLGFLGPLFMVAYLGTASPSWSRQTGGAIRAAGRATRKAVRPGISAVILMSICTTVLATSLIWVGEAFLGSSFMVDPPDLSAAAQRTELLFRLLIAWPVEAVGLGVLALLPPRIVLDGTRNTERAVSLSGRIARRAPLVCLLIGLLEAAGQVIRAGTSASTVYVVSSVVGMASVFGAAMANALLLHTRPWQPIEDEAAPDPHQPLLEG